MNKYKKHLTDEDIQVLKNTMRKHNDVKSPVELMAESIVTEQEKELLRLMYFRFTHYEQQKQQINNLKTEILIINNDAVNSGDEVQMKITGRVIEALENTIIDDWRVEFE